MRVQVGHLKFGSDPIKAIAVDYRTIVSANSRFASDRTIIETLYLACQDSNDESTMLANLRHGAHAHDDVGSITDGDPANM